ncbi:hypothetical protein GCM10029992_22150 [Glycomyces albus]
MRVLNPGIAESFRRVGHDLRAWTPGEAAPVLAVRAACGIAVAMVVVQALGAPGGAPRRSSGPGWAGSGCSRPEPAPSRACRC